MQKAATWIGTVGLLFVLAASASGEKPPVEANAQPAATQPAQPPEEIDPALVSTINAVVPEDFVVHKGPDGEFTIKSPPSWNEAPGPRAPVAMILKPQAHGASISIVVVPAPPGERLKAAMESMPKQLARQFNGFKLIKSDYVLYCGRPSGRIVYETDPAKGIRIRIMSIIVMRGGKDYAIAFAAPVKDYDAAYKAAEPVIASFNLPGEEPASQPAR